MNTRIPPVWKLIAGLLVLAAYGIIAWQFGDSGTTGRRIGRLVPHGTSLDDALAALEQDGFTVSVERFDGETAPLPADLVIPNSLGARIRNPDGSVTTVTNLVRIRCEKVSSRTNITADIWLENDTVRGHESYEVIDTSPAR